MKSKYKHRFTRTRQEVDHLKTIPSELVPQEQAYGKSSSEKKDNTVSKKDNCVNKLLTLLLLVITSVFPTESAAQSSDFAIDLDGAGDHLSIPHDFELRPTTAITIELWVNADDLSSGNHNLYRKEDGNERHLLAFQNNGTILSFGLATDGVYSELDVPINPADFINTWMHVAATYDGSFRRIYVNGTVIDSVATTGTMTSAGSAPVLIGSFVGTGEFFDGQVDEVRMWRSARTTAEINAWKDRRLSGGEPRLRLYLPFNEETGLSFADISISGFTASHLDILKVNVASRSTGLIPIFSQGSGTSNDPFQIKDVIALQGLRELLGGPVMHFAVMNDIDASSTFGWFNEAGFAPIGTTALPFSHAFNGQGFPINHLRISRSSQDVVGLFGETASGSLITQVRLVDLNIRGRNAVGGLVGFNRFSGTITQSSTNGTVLGEANFIGGLVGINHGTIAQSSASGNVVGDRNVGGLVGQHDFGSITNSLATNIVSGSIGPSGNFIGLRPGGLSSGNFHIDEGIPGVGDGSSDGITAAILPQLRDISTFTGAGWDFNTIWAIDPNVNNGYPFLQEQQGNSLVITGGEGWRLMTSPVQSTSFDTLLNGLWTQGFPGASTTSGTPNVLLWDEATQSFTAPTSLSQVLSPGQGFLMYVFSDDDNDGTAEGFPKVLSNSGTQHSGAAAPALSFTSTGVLANDGFNLVGNPYGTSIQWDAANGWTRTNLDASFYVWSDSASAGTGSYLSWNGSTGTLPNGKIAPWQGFWVKANAASPAISFTDSVRNTGGTFFKRRPTPQLKLKLEGAGKVSQSVIMFHPQAEISKDPLDTYKLQSLNGNFLSLGTNLIDEPIMDIQSLPMDLEKTVLELDIQGSDLKGSFMLSWNPQSIRDDWSLVLVDRQTGHEYDMSSEGEVWFELKNEKVGIRNRQASRPNLSIPDSLVQVVRKLKGKESRFVLHIRTGVSVVVGDDPTLPTEVTLDQNYPNPFNPTTNISFVLPEAENVKLRVYDLLGREVVTLVNGRQAAGRFTIPFNASALSSGVYIYRLQTGSGILTRKMVLVK